MVLTDLGRPVSNMKLVGLPVTATTIICERVM
jgi:hypothetical protein